MTSSQSPVLHERPAAQALGAWLVRVTDDAAAVEARKRQQDRWVGGDVWVAIAADTLHVTAPPTSWTLALADGKPSVSDIDELP
ncbi:MAG: hypothetical protein O2782_16620 [bacterium]|nr:hypothetical protein [bacterium]